MCTSGILCLLVVRPIDEVVHLSCLQVSALRFDDFPLFLQTKARIVTDDYVSGVICSWDLVNNDQKYQFVPCPDILHKPVDLPEDAIDFVGATRYAPVGYRSSGPTRALMVHGPNYHDEANEKIISFAMIETVEALENVEKIAATDGLTGIYIGPSDLSISMGFKPGLDRVEPEMIDAIKKIESACKDNNIKVGIHCLSPSYLKDKLSNGYDLATLASDVRIYAEGISNKMKEARS